jgi:HPt (histidine-containing phosphotransfer) domain-containing protein
VHPNDPSLGPEVIAALKDLDGETGTFFTDFMTTFMQETAERYERLLLATSRSDWRSEVAALAHSLKGSCGSAGATICAEICRDIEQAAEVGDKPMVVGLTQRLKVELGNVRTALADELLPATWSAGADQRG